MIKMISFPSAVGLITAATLPGARREGERSGPALLSPDAGRRQQAMRQLGMRQRGGLIFGLVRNTVAEPQAKFNRLAAQLSAVYLTAEDAAELTRGLFGVLIPDYFPSPAFFSNPARREAAARSYYRRELVMPLAEILQKQEAPKISPLTETDLHEEIEIDVNNKLTMVFLVGTSIPAVLRPIAKAWARVGINFPVYGGNEEKAYGEISERATPTEQFYNYLVKTARL